MKTINVTNELKKIYLFTKENTEYEINVNDNAKLMIYIFSYNTSCVVNINLNSINSEIEYHYNTINIDDNNVLLNINHNNSKTISNVYLHALNILDNKIEFNVNGNILEKYDDCICNEENQIINIKNGKGIIKPNLFINYYNISSSHAAYIGNFKNDDLFYLKSRGITHNDAITLLAKSLLIGNADVENEVVKDFITYLERN